MRWLIRSVTFEEVGFTDTCVECRFEETHLRRIHLVLVNLCMLERQGIFVIVPEDTGHDHTANDRHEREIEEIEE